MKPGDFPVGSLASRAAARAMLNRSNAVTCVVVTTGLPSPFMDQEPVVKPPDSVAYYLAADESVVTLIFREYEPARFTAFIDQTWKDWGVYHGECRVESLAGPKNLRQLGTRPEAAP